MSDMKETNFAVLVCPSVRYIDKERRRGVCVCVGSLIGPLGGSVQNKDPRDLVSLWEVEEGKEIAE